MADLAEVMDLVDLALARSEGRIDALVVADLKTVGRRIRMRGGFIGEVLAVALAGGTGSGKSSIVNALVGDDVVSTGIIRPTTQVASAVYPDRKHVDFTPLLDGLAVDVRIAHEGVGDLVVVDLPDFDSTVDAHRHVVEEVLPLVDSVVWVLDPEKYSDPVLHKDFLQTLVPYETQFIFALNQTDRLGDGVDKVVESLTSLLTKDGFRSPDVAAIAAAPHEGVASIGALTHALEERLDIKNAATAKLAIDVRRLASSGYEACLQVSLEDMGQASLDALALSAATFVSLGVAAYDLYHGSLRAQRKS